MIIGGSHDNRFVAVVRTGTRSQLFAAANAEWHQKDAHCGMGNG